MASTLPSRGEARSPSPLPAPSRRDRTLIASCIVLITGLAWAYLVHLNRHMTSPINHDTMMAAMGMVVNQPWGAGDLLLTFVMWSVMMVGMMAVPALPVLLFAGMRLPASGSRRVAGRTVFRPRLPHCLACLQRLFDRRRHRQRRRLDGRGLAGRARQPRDHGRCRRGRRRVAEPPPRRSELVRRQGQGGGARRGQARDRLRPAHRRRRAVARPAARARGACSTSRSSTAAG